MFSELERSCGALASRRLVCVEVPRLCGGERARKSVSVCLCLRVCACVRVTPPCAKVGAVEALAREIARAVTRSRQERQLNPANSTSAHAPRPHAAGGAGGPYTSDAERPVYEPTPQNLQGPYTSDSARAVTHTAPEAALSRVWALSPGGAAGGAASGAAAYALAEHVPLPEHMPLSRAHAVGSAAGGAASGAAAGCASVVRGGAVRGGAVKAPDAARRKQEGAVAGVPQPKGTKGVRGGAVKAPDAALSRAYASGGAAGSGAAAGGASDAEVVAEVVRSRWDSARMCCDELAFYRRVIGGTCP